MKLSQKPRNPVEAYESFYVPAIFEPLSGHVLAAARLRPGDRVLDLACGTGIVARRAASAVGETGQVTAVDLRPGMLAVARALPPVGGVPILWQEADAHSLPLEDRTFDAVLCQQGLQFFADREQALREMKRVSKPGARVVFACWREFELHEFFKAMAEVELTHLAELGMSREEMMAPFSLASAEEVARLCRNAGLSDGEIMPQTIEATFPNENFVYNMEFAYSAVMPQFAENPARFDAYVEIVTKETAELCAKHSKDGRIVAPMHTWVATARA